MKYSVQPANCSINLYFSDSAEHGHCVFVETSRGSTRSTIPWLSMIYLDSSQTGWNVSLSCISVISAFSEDWLFRLCANFLTSPCYIFIFKYCFLSNFLNSEVDLNLSSSETGFQMLETRWEWSSHCTSVKFWETVVDFEIFGTQSLQLWCSSLFQRNPLTLNDRRRIYILHPESFSN